MTCTKAQGFLAQHGLQPATLVNAKKSPRNAKQALALIRDVDDIFATRGKKVIQVNLAREKPDSAQLLELLIGPSGNLRAPTLRVGRTLLVGFDEASYRQVFGLVD